MGDDGAEDVDGILELRLNHEGDRSVLNYGPEWLHWYFEVWRWEKIARGVSSSIHLHSEGDFFMKLERAKNLFGVDSNSCRYNSLGTVEVRSALGGYVDNRLDGRGYSELPPPVLIELLHLVEDTHSPLFLAVRGRLGQTAWRSRIGDHNKYAQQLDEQLLNALENNDFQVCKKLFHRVDRLSHNMQATAVEMAMENDEYNLVLRCLGLLNPSLQKAVVSEICRVPSDWTNMDLVSQIGLLDPEIQATVIEYALGCDKNNAAVIYYLVDQINICTQKQQLDLVERAISTDEEPILKKLIENIYRITSPYLRDHVAQELIDRGHDKYVYKLIKQFDSLSPGLQNNILDKELSKGYGTMDLTDYMGVLSPEQQERVIENILTNYKIGMFMISLEDYVYQIKSEELRLECLARLYRRSSLFLQTVIQHNTGRRNEAKLRETS